ncbi:TIGR03757 family integrating conjugative element protein [Citrobacter sp. S2-9]|uniref:TIGR03757 family integrating conjugative element protein n=1 Tax=Citrobacter enshiensis TaxID=2971264 RepID=A0ABT8PW49_9ENTR|nr:TIGR03757 family integrating conjugative element protein [Citrobacter enshiensis]MDN8600317.1 TIGR03757 family integrating conjugative element protein [Citrobacter enshiensis]
MPRDFFVFLLLIFSATSPAQTVIYTTSRYPVVNPQPGVPVQILEDVSQLEQVLFPTLSQNPQQAEQQARLRMQQPDWRTQEARLTRAYQALLDAYTLGIEKVPAVVFDERDVVYGTSDVALAQKKRDAWRESQR